MLSCKGLYWAQHQQVFLVCLFPWASISDLYTLLFPQEPKVMLFSPDHIEGSSYTCTHLSSEAHCCRSYTCTQHLSSEHTAVQVTPVRNISLLKNKAAQTCS
jgi:hypothetical protein